MVRYNQTKRGFHPLVCVPTTQEYRQLANIHVKPTDNVLEGAMRQQGPPTLPGDHLCYRGQEVAIEVLGV